VLEGARVIVVTPAGRRRYLEVLLPYVLCEREWLDEYQLWVNTTDDSDLAYLRRVADQHADFVRLVRGSHVPAGSRTVREFYPAASDPGSVYVKLDDDICFVAPGSLRALAAFRLYHEDYLIVYANTVNTVLASYIHQHLGIMDTTAGTARPDALCPAAWRSGRFAAAAHRQFLKAVHDDGLDRYRFGVWTLQSGKRCSINACAWLGSDFAAFGGVIAGRDDEYWLTVVKSRELKRPSCVLGDAVASHFAYGPQRYYLERCTRLLDAYRAMSEQAADAVRG
jgi:hypothetical protein